MLIGTSSFPSPCSKRKEECSLLFEKGKGKGFFSGETYAKISSSDVAPGVTWCLTVYSLLDFSVRIHTQIHNGVFEEARKLELRSFL